jgi:hypothetical protein
MIQYLMLVTCGLIHDSHITLPVFPDAVSVGVFPSEPANLQKQGKKA